ncbi:thermonuclease family protein [Sphingomonas soli]|uniref:thermonuclease family protein n=1 Tax=Sphingomonas soli TaxID=266127 RepID=UPI00082B7ECA|nr:thermonuclease family protein [Sphingomonas soli]
MLAALSLLIAAAPAGAACVAVDGDTLRCGDERVRLLGIDAPELPWHCQQGRHCAPGDPYASTRSLRAALSRGPVSLRRFGTDHYGPTLALVSAGGVDLSCWQLSHGQAIYKSWWDNGGQLARICPAAR